ncbi:hypothetical protein IWW34DRAFT_638317 [Fusarium oxysporum f. sp. albedinis]|nr:hypothetical protein IWW34DRAFT_638317 [Fusarium oxysporum f. sp. albedinis]
MAVARGASIATEIAEQQCIPEPYHPLLRERLRFFCRDAVDLWLYRSKDDLDTWKWPKLFLHDGIRTTLDELAFELQLMEDKNYRHILEQLKPPSPKPTTAALNTGGTDNVVFTEPKIKAFRAMAGEWLYDYATDAEFTSSTSTLPGVKAHVSFESMEQDVVIWIKINRADEVLECLFPFAVATARSQEMAYSIADGDSEGEPWFYITGASVSAFARPVSFEVGR